MTRILIFLFAILAAPAMAQSQFECKGKPKFSLSDGTNGCVLHLDKGMLNSTVSSGGDRPTRKSTQRAVELYVSVSGTYSKKMRTINGRIKELCQMYHPQLVAVNADKSARKIIVVMFWPGRVLGQAEETAQAVSYDVPYQGASMELNCTAPRNFGRRPG